MRFISELSRMIWSWKRGCQEKGICFSLEKRVTDCLNPPIVVANRPCLLAMFCIILFLPVVETRHGTSLPADTLIRTIKCK